MDNGQHNQRRLTSNPILSFILTVMQYFVGLGLPAAVPMDYEPAVEDGGGLESSVDLEYVVVDLSQYTVLDSDQQYMYSWNKKKRRLDCRNGSTRIGYNANNPGVVCNGQPGGVHNCVPVSDGWLAAWRLDCRIRYMAANQRGEADFVDVISVYLREAYTAAQLPDAFIGRMTRKVYSLKSRLIRERKLAASMSPYQVVLNPLMYNLDVLTQVITLTPMSGRLFWLPGKVLDGYEPPQGPMIMEEEEEDLLPPEQVVPAVLPPPEAMGVDPPVPEEPVAVPVVVPGPPEPVTPPPGPAVYGNNIRFQQDTPVTPPPGPAVYDDNIRFRRDPPQRRRDMQARQLFPAVPEQVVDDEIYEYAVPHELAERMLMVRSAQLSDYPPEHSMARTSRRLRVVNVPAEQPQSQDLYFVMVTEAEAMYIQEGRRNLLQAIARARGQARGDE